MQNIPSIAPVVRAITILLLFIFISFRSIQLFHLHFDSSPAAISLEIEYNRAEYV